MSIPGRNNMYKQIVDLSHHNTVKSWKQLANAVDGVIIRMGYGINHEDKKAKEFLRGAIEYDVPYALYWYSYALNQGTIREEAEYFCDAVAGYSPRFLAIDMEDADSYKKKNGVFKNELELIQKSTNLIYYWIETMKENTTVPLGVYMNQFWWMHSAYVADPGIVKWVARWSENEPSISWDIWQYSSKASVAGVEFPVDISKTEDKHRLWNILEEVLYEDENVRLYYKGGAYCLEAVINGLDKR